MLGAVANRPAGERLSDAQLQQIRRRRRAGELLRLLAAEYGVSERTLRRRLKADDAARADGRARPTDPVWPPAAAPDPAGKPRPAAAPAPARRATETQPASRRELLSSEALAAAAAEEADRLEAAYQQAFSAIETLLSAIERVQELRGHQPHWEQALKRGVAPERPEPWQVRASHNDQLHRLNRRLKDALNSGW
jgi:hypothetical protein